MSLITFRDRNTKGDPIGPTWYLQFDAATVEEYARTAEVTTYPVETGAVLSDHYQPQPRQIALAGVVSDTPSEAWTNIESLQNAAQPPVMVTRPLALTLRPDPLRVGSAQGIIRPIATGPLPSQRLIRANIERSKLYVPRSANTLQVASAEVPTESGISRSATRSRISNFLAALDGLMEYRIPVSIVLLTGAEYTDMMITDLRAPRVSGSGGSIHFAIDLQQVIQARPAESRASEVRDEPALQKRKTAGRKGNKKVKPFSVESKQWQDLAAKIKAGPQ